MVRVCGEQAWQDDDQPRFDLPHHWVPQDQLVVPCGFQECR